MLLDLESNEHRALDNTSIHKGAGKAIETRYRSSIDVPHEKEVMVFTIERVWV